jgi:hypothetical protein
MKKPVDLSSPAGIARLASEAYSALDVLNCLGSSAYRDRLFDVCADEERRHRKYAPEGFRYPKAATVANAARLFTVKYIVDALLGERYGIKDVLYLKPSVIYAQAIAENFGPEIRRALEGFDLRELCAMDYVTFVDNK